MSDDAGIAALAALGGLLFFFAAIGIAIAVFFLLNLSGALSAVKPENRQMQPGLVWLNLIPFFGLVWIFITAIKLGDSLVSEARDQSLDFGDGGKSLGIALGVLNIATIIPLIGILAGIAALVVFILYWVKIAGYKNTLRRA